MNELNTLGAVERAERAEARYDELLRSTELQIAAERRHIDTSVRELMEREDRLRERAEKSELALHAALAERDHALALSAKAADTVVGMSLALTEANRRAEQAERELAELAKLYQSALKIIFKPQLEIEAAGAKARRDALIEAENLCRESRSAQQAYLRIHALPRWDGTQPFTCGAGHRTKEENNRTPSGVEENSGNQK